MLVSIAGSKVLLKRDKPSIIRQALPIRERQASLVSMVKKVGLQNTAPRDEGLIASLQSPLALLRESVHSVPANIYAVGVVGIVAAAVICIELAAGKWQVALGGGVAVFAGMVVLRIFASAASQPGRRRQKSTEAAVLTWICLIAFVVILSFFLGKVYLALFPQPHEAPAHTNAPADGSFRAGDVKQEVKGDGNTTVGTNTGTIENKGSPEPKGSSKKENH